MTAGDRRHRRAAGPQGPRPGDAARSARSTHVYAIGGDGEPSWVGVEASFGLFNKRMSSSRWRG